MIRNDQKLNRLKVKMWEYFPTLNLEVDPYSSPHSNEQSQQNYKKELTSRL